MKKISLIFSIIVFLGVLYYCFETIDTQTSVKTLVTIKSSEANVRSMPNMRSNIIINTSKGNQFEYIESVGNWHKILVNNDTAYLHKNVADIEDQTIIKNVIRRYDNSLKTRYSLIGGSMILLIIGNTIIYKRNRIQKVGNNTINLKSNKYEDYLTIAHSLAADKKWLEAIQYYSKALQLNSNSHNCYFGIASCYFKLNMTEESIINSKKGLNIAPNDKEGNFNLGLTYYLAKRQDDALLLFKKVLDLDDNHSRSHYLLGISLENDLLAIFHLEKAVQGHLEDSEMVIAKRLLQTRYLIIGNNAFKNNNSIDGLKYYEKALFLESINDDKRVYEIAADYLSEGGFPELAIQFLDLAIFPYKIRTKTKTTINSTVTNKFSKEYFELLRDFSDQILIISRKLSSDEILIEKIEHSLTESSIEDFVSYCILFDLSQILKIISNGSIKVNSIETFGLSIIAPKIFESKSVDFFSLGYEAMVSLYLNQEYESYTDSIIEMSEKINPLQINVESNNGDQENLQNRFQNVLSLPTSLKIIDHSMFDQYATLLYRFATIMSKADGLVTSDEEKNLKDIYQITHNPIPDSIHNLTITEADRNNTLDAILEELDSLIGLNDVKQEVRSLINFIKIQKEREKLGLKSSQVSYHCVFTGSPGTGKTTIARMISMIYMHLGVLEKGHLVETDRSGLVAEYTGQTAMKVNKAIDSALDGILFIDEAYSLIGGSQDDFGREAVATLMKRMEDNRERLIVILAGYTEEMNEFIETNPGFKSRFNRFIEFKDYSTQEMESIFKLQCAKLDYKLTYEAQNKLSILFEEAFKRRDKTFGNGRFVRNTFEKTLENQANRIARLSTLTKEILTNIEEEDIVFP